MKGGQREGNWGQPLLQIWIGDLLNCKGLRDIAENLGSAGNLWGSAGSSVGNLRGNLGGLCVLWRYIGGGTSLREGLS